MTNTVPKELIKNAYGTRFARAFSMTLVDEICDPHFWAFQPFPLIGKVAEPGDVCRLDASSVL